jgi:hypothetical protein
MKNCGMKRNRLAGSIVLAMTLCGMAAARADADAFRYASIVERNPFGLRPIVKVVESVPPPVVPPAPLAVVELTGVLNIPFPRALLEITPPGKPMIKPILTEGERIDSIELVSIDVDKGQVVIKTSGIITNVPLKIAKASTSAPPPAGRGAVAMSDGSTFEAAARFSAGNGVRTIPSRSMRAGLPPSPASPIGLSPEAAVIDLEHSRRSNPASFPPLPPTALTPNLTAPVPPM